jgi:release factor glutamine methyltransferase
VVTVLEVIQRSTDFLARKGIDTPRLQAELLLAGVLKLPRLKLYLDFERRLGPAELDTVRHLVQRRAAHEPLQYLLGTTSFCGLEIHVNPDVLIPRPETEVLAEQAWKFLKDQVELTGSARALDFGTGSGCLAIALAAQVPQARIWAVEASAAAIVVAKENAALHQLSDRIEFFEGTGLARVPSSERFDLIVSNPPYIPTKEIGGLQLEVREHEPRLALDGGETGLDSFVLLAREALPLVKPEGRLMMELGDGQSGAVSQILEEKGWMIERIVPDLAGRARILVARPPES